MSVRIHRRRTTDGGFAQIPNETLRDPRLSYRARGILSDILSRPDDWSTSAAAIAAMARRSRGDKGEGLWTVLRAFRELEDCGYMRRRRLRGDRGRMTTEVHFYDVPEDRTNNSPAERPGTETPATSPSDSRRSSRRPVTKNETRTDHQSAAPSLSTLLQPKLPDLADDERERFSNWLVRPDSKVRNPVAYLRSISEDDLMLQLTAFRASSNGRARPQRLKWCGNCDERTRMRDTEDGRRVEHCPDCSGHALPVTTTTRDIE